MKTDSKNANMQLEVILQENIELKTVTIPNMQKEFEVDLNQERDRYAELEKRFRALKEKADALSSFLDAAKNEIVRLKNRLCHTKLLIRIYHGLAGLMPCAEASPVIRPKPVPEPAWAYSSWWSC